MSETSPRPALTIDGVSVREIHSRLHGDERLTPVDPILTLEDVCRLTSLSRTSVYRHVGEGSFPKPKKIGAGKRGRIGWPASEVRAWADSRPRAEIARAA